MLTMHEYLKTVIQTLTETLPRVCQQVNDPKLDRTGDRTHALSLRIRSLAIAEYLMDSDANKFKKNLDRSAKLSENLLDRFDKGEPIEGSLVSILCYQNLFDFLAAGNMVAALRFAKKMEERNKTEKENVTRFDHALGYTLKWVVQNEQRQMVECVNEFTYLCEHTEKNFLGYAEVFAAILNSDLNLAQEGVKDIIAGHKKEASRGIFQDTLDKYLCIWGVGITNLARYRGLALEINDPLIPKELLTDLTNKVE